ncbi:MAG: DUF2267 domain-containing protein [Cytophagaceae bacterium]
MTVQSLKPKTQEFLLALSKYLEFYGDRDKSKRILVSVLHALRDTLSFDQSLQVLSSLPVNLKSIYIYNWSISESGTTISPDTDFLKVVIKRAGKLSHYDFPEEKKALQNIRSVFSFIEENIPESKMAIIRSNYPDSLKKILNEK